MSKQHNSGNKKLDSLRVSKAPPHPDEDKNRDWDGDGIPDHKDDELHYETGTRKEDFVYKPKKRKPMLKRILTSKIAKGILSAVGGVVGFGGSVFAGLDPEFAFVVAATAVIAIFGGMEKAAKFKGLFDNELKDQDSK